MAALIIHGGAGGIRPRAERDQVAESLLAIARDTWARLEAGASATDAAVHATVQLEDDPLFNAGRGSKLQQDGAARLSAALMDGYAERFSGVVNVEGVVNPILLAASLQHERDRVLSGAGARERAIELGLDMGDVRTERSVQRWRERVEGSTGTVGAVVVDLEHRVAAATSTGGRGFERVGRVSDSATVAGNFASPMAGVSCTGIGEDIIDGALAARLVARVEAGCSLAEAGAEIVHRMQQHQWSAGLIALDRNGEWIAPTTTDIMYWVAMDDSGEHRFADPGD